MVSFNASTLAAGTHYIYAMYGGDANYAGSMSKSFPILVGDFTIAASPTSASATAGQSTGKITLTYNGTMDFSQYLYGGSSGVTLACSGLPQGAACVFSSTNIVPMASQNGTTQGSATLTIATEGPTLQASAATGRPGATLPAALAGLLVLCVPLALRRRRFLGALMGMALLVLAAGLNGCSSTTTSSGYHITNPGTPAGTSTVTVTATVSGGVAGTLSHTATVTLTVAAAGQ